VVIDVINIQRVTSCNAQDNSPIGANRYRPESLELTLERMQPKARQVHVGNGPGGIEANQNVTQFAYVFRLKTHAYCYFYNSVIVELSSKEVGMAASKKRTDEQVLRFADMFSALGTEPRLRIMRLLLSAHPDGMVVGDIITELGITASTLSHHLEKLKNEDLVKVQRESTFLRYSANAEALQELLVFLYAECCTRNKAVEPQAIVSLCR
jgi:ArsR family transcriptional regulator, arsenate/arsenite/antimonite-responsive transcriptional repressor